MRWTHDEPSSMIHKGRGNQSHQGLAVLENNNTVDILGLFSGISMQPHLRCSHGGRPVRESSASSHIYGHTHGHASSHTVKKVSSPHHFLGGLIILFVGPYPTHVTDLYGPQVPPEVTYSSSTVLLDATVKSPIHVLFPADSSSSGEEESCGEDDEALTLTALRRSRSPSPRRRGGSRRQLFSPGHSSGARVTRDGRGGRSSGRRSARGRGVSPGPHQPNVAGLSKSLTAQERLHSLLSSYVESNGAAPPPPAGAGGRQAPYRVKFKPTHHRSRRELGKCGLLMRPYQTSSD